ncbi:MAG: bifunctional phosphoribosylaminoimidazolecarboxamide formyltransferase/IMP cyclohydrolase [Acidobacteria bacterium]|nr:bifunctional phosphoribosylaminoimidazolecarboxamide formyltransferase/IMP cyclohydrolase [Acidobacteriota bacterium]MCI0620758.1 bifunctional phosphoribosylaminoimidazolecarboxamide formyltransferase/IMP cyclohydrolase [Acidobacteriota bacterium]MCI0719682.1 bifunctional phosphoribosylaminoimidazolecarboxamide formyltransferase/IMP cyclohydrolase [Acidobacteriota bacterium]
MLKRALISVSKKDGIIEFAKGLADLQIDIVSTGGTARALREAGVVVQDISVLTGFPEILDGRVKTLHPKVHGGLLGIRSNPSHQQQMAEQDIAPIDLVVVNLYPFEETAARPGIEFEEVIENIDIGGPSMIRSAAKNFRDVGVIVDPADYGWVLEELKQSHSGLSLESRFKLARKAFHLTAGYDAAIASHLFKLRLDAGNFHLTEGFPQKLLLSMDKVSDLRYGENPHQRAAFYREMAAGNAVLADAVQLQGKELSFNNLTDLNAAFQLSSEFERPCAVIVKHTNPCGAAVSAHSLAEAYVKARECDPLSAFGSVLGFNRTLDKETAREIALTFVEAVIAPDFAPEALSLLASKKNLRLLKYQDSAKPFHSLDYKRVEGGLLVQEADRQRVSVSEWKVVTERSPSAEEAAALLFAWKVVKHVKSNAIVYANGGQTVGIGAGQMSRVDAAQIGISKAKLPIQGCVLASDAFFPFRDSIDVAAKAGIRAVIQPGGSVRDDEVIQAANEHGIAMVFTGVRHFKH